MQRLDIAGHDMGVDFGGLDIGVTQQFLEDADVGAVFQYVGGESVAQCVAVDLFVDAGGALPGREHPLPPVSWSALWYLRLKASGILTSPKPFPLAYAPGVC